jgi:hypothetical protein
MATVEYQLAKRELILTGVLRKLGRLRTLVGLSLIFVGGVLLVAIGDSYRVLGWFLLAYAILYPFLLALAVQQHLNANPVFTSKTTLIFSDSGIISVREGVRFRTVMEFSEIVVPFSQVFLLINGQSGNGCHHSQTGIHRTAARIVFQRIGSCRR